MFKNIDNFFFQYIELFKSSNTFQQFSSKFYSMDDVKQKRISRLLSFSTFILPLLIIGMLFISNCNTISEINTKKNILTSASNIEKKLASFSNIKRSFVSFTKINNESDVKNLINKISQNSTLNAETIIINDFKSNNIMDNLSKTEFNLKFKNINNTELADLFEGLMKEQINIININLFLSENKNSINGDLNLALLGK